MGTYPIHLNKSPPADDCNVKKEKSKGQKSDDYSSQSDYECKHDIPGPISETECGVNQQAGADS